MQFSAKTITANLKAFCSGVRGFANQGCGRARTFNMDHLDAKLGELGSRGLPRQRVETVTEVI